MNILARPEGTYVCFQSWGRVSGKASEMLGFLHVAPGGGGRRRGMMEVSVDWTPEAPGGLRTASGIPCAPGGK